MRKDYKQAMKNLKEQINSNGYAYSKDALEKAVKDYISEKGHKCELTHDESGFYLLTESVEEEIKKQIIDLAKQL